MDFFGERLQFEEVEIAEAELTDQDRNNEPTLLFNKAKIYSMNVESDAAFFKQHKLKYLELLRAYDILLFQELRSSP